jgi:hypothetical protein
MANVNVNLAGMSLQVYDILGGFFRVNVQETTITLPASTAAYEAYLLIASGAGTVLPMPAATIWFAIIHNLSATANLTVQAQPVGGALPSAANSPVLTPGGIYIYANQVETTGGLTAITLVQSIASQPVEFLLAT